MIKVLQKGWKPATGSAPQNLKHKSYFLWLATDLENVSSGRWLGEM